LTLLLSSPLRVLTWNNLRLLGWNETGLLGWDEMRLLGQDGTRQDDGKNLRKTVLFMKIKGWQCSNGCLLGKYLIHHQSKILLVRTGWVATL